MRVCGLTLRQHRYLGCGLVLAGSIGAVSWWPLLFAVVGVACVIVADWCEYHRWPA